MWVRRQKDDIVLYRIGFNSRTRVGATPVPVILLISGLVSIHAPVWVRLRGHEGNRESKGFNSRTRVGATL